MDYKNLDQALAFQDLKKMDRVLLKNNLSAKRISLYSAAAGSGITYNYAAMPVNNEIIEKLQELCDEMELTEKYVALLSGEMMNTGEKRLVLHHLTRGNVLGTPVVWEGEDKEAFYKGELEKIKDFAEKVHSGKITGSTGKKFTSVCQIGIGGSDLGPRALYMALKGYERKMEAYFISNVDPDDAAEVIKHLDFETTLFVLVSKSGTTQETLTNRDLVLKTLESSPVKGLDPKKHMVAVTSKTSPLAKDESMLESFFIDDFI